MLSEFWGYLSYLFKGYGIFFKIIKRDIGYLDPPPLPGPHYQYKMGLIEKIFQKSKVKMNVSLFYGLSCLHDIYFVINGHWSRLSGHFNCRYDSKQYRP